MIDFHNTYLMNDQPTTCPKCGARTHFTMQISPVSNEAVQIHQCMNQTCQFEFVVETEEMLVLDYKNQD